MIKYAKIINDKTKACDVALGTDVDFYKSMGMQEMDVEEGYYGQWYLNGYAPVQPLDEVKAQMLAQDKAERAEAVNKITVEVDGMAFDGGEHAQARMANAIKASEILGRSSVIWVLANDEVATVTVEQLKEAFAKSVVTMGELWPRPYERA